MNYPVVQGKMEKLKQIVSQVLELGGFEVDDQLQKGSGSWDSFNHLLLINELEKFFVIKFTMKEVTEIKNFADLRIIIERKFEKNE